MSACSIICHVRLKVLSRTLFYLSFTLSIEIFHVLFAQFGRNSWFGNILLGHKLIWWCLESLNEVYASYILYNQPKYMMCELKPGVMVLMCPIRIVLRTFMKVGWSMPSLVLNMQHIWLVVTMDTHIKPKCMGSVKIYKRGKMLGSPWDLEMSMLH